MPVELLLDPATRAVVGFLLPYFPDAVPVSELLDPAGRAGHGVADTPDVRLALAVAVTRRLDAVHRARLVVGDLAPANVLAGVRRGRIAGRVFVIDTNSFHVCGRGPKGTEVFPSGVATERYAAPEVQAADWATGDRTVWSDAFAHAVIVWQLLLGGSHPHDVITPPGVDPPPMGDRIRDGQWAYGPAQPLPAGWRPVPTDPAFGALPAAVHDLFHRAFRAGHDDARRRPTPAEWLTRLSAWHQDRRPTAARRVLQLLGRHVPLRLPVSLPPVFRRPSGWAVLTAAVLGLAVLPAFWTEAAEDAPPAGPPQALVATPPAPPPRLPPADPALFPPALLDAFGVQEPPP